MKLKRFFLVLLSVILSLAYLLPVGSLVLADTVYEQFLTYDTSRYIHDSTYVAQTFTANATHDIYGVAVLLGTYGTPVEDITASIRTTDQSGNITGVIDLAYGSISCTEITPSGAWIDIPFTIVTELENGVQYGLILSSPLNPDGDIPRWYYKVAGGYTGGSQSLSSDSGVTWVQNNSDCTFQIYGSAPFIQGASSLNVTTGLVTYTTTGGNVIYSFSGSTDNIATLRGFEIGLADGLWEQTLNLQELASSALSWNGTAGSYLLSTTLLSSNTTYFWRAYAGIFSQSYGWFYAYGSTANFTTTTAGYSSVIPVVTTNAVLYFDGSLQVSGTIISSSSTVIERGFYYGLTELLGSGSSDIGTFPNGYFVKSTTAGQAAGIPYAAGTVIYAQAYAKNALGNYGYGSILSYTVPAWNVGPGGLLITNGEVTINGNSATLTAIITNPANVAITRYGFTWGIATNDNSWNTSTSGTITEISHVVTGLEANTVYYFNAGVMVSGSWYWSLNTPFTTGASLPNITGGGPVVITLAATEITSTGFLANGNLLSVGDTVGSYVSERGFVYSSVNTGSLSEWQKISVTGNFSIGTFSRQTTVSEAGITLYFAAMAKNQYATSYGAVFYAELATGGTGGSGSGTREGILGFIHATLASWGMDNTMGHWAFLGIFELIIALLFGVAFFSVDSRLKLPLGIIWSLVSIAFLGMFMFSGMLGVWPIIILVAGVAALILVITSLKLSGGG